MPRIVPSSTEAQAYYLPEVTLDLDHSYSNPAKRKAKKPSTQLMVASGNKTVN